MPVATAPLPTTTGPKSCVSCPSFIADTKQSAVMGANINGPICGIKMLPLIMPNQPREAQMRAMAQTAEECPSFGIDVDITPLGVDATPYLPVGMDAESMSIAPSPNQANARCSDCAHFVSSRDVNSSTGWTASICRAKGTLMADGRAQNYAKSCGKYSQRYGPRPAGNPLAKFTYMPVFSFTFGKRDPIADYRSRVRRMLEPKDHPTESVITDAHKARGIISWRKIIDPEGYGASVYLPIFDINFFPESLRVLVPQTGDKEHPELYADHGQLTYTMTVLWRELDETPAWWGQGGTGKTEFGRYLAWLMQLPYHRINLTAASELDDVIGKMLFLDGETKYQPGRLTKAWDKPGIILLDEPNTAPEDIWQKVRPMLDSSRRLFLDEDNAQFIDRGVDTYAAMAMNPAWDPRNSGTRTLGDADSSRLMHMFFGLPPHDLEVEIIQKRVALDGWQLSNEYVMALMGVATELRKAEDNFHSTWGMRHQIKVARALKWWPPVVAYRRAVGDALEPQQNQFLLTVVNNHFKSK